MRRYILGAKLVTLAVWTAVCLGAYALLNLVADGLIRHSDALPVRPEGIEFASWLLALFQTIGVGLIIGVWLLGVIVILVVGWIARRFASGPEQPLPTQSMPTQPMPGRDGEPTRRLPERPGTGGRR